MIFVIADDLTGAAEIAGICIRYGIDVVFGVDSIPEKKATVTVIATDSRSMTEEDAYVTHLHLAKKIIKDQKNAILFKKCDSALRGHIVTELASLALATKKKQILLQPSNPVAKRIIQNGMYWIENNLIENTGFSNDPDFPATTSCVKNLLLFNTKTKFSKLKVGCYNSNVISKEGIVIPDCTSIEDLKKCAQLFHPELILSGSSAFFEQFLVTQGFKNSKVRVKKIISQNKYLLISGSTHPESMNFAKKIESTHCPLLLFPDALIAKEIDPSQLKQWVIEICEIYDKTQKLTLRTSDVILEFPNSSKILKNRMSLVVRELIELNGINDLYIEGGATAYAILQELNFKNLTPIAELSPGVVRMQLTRNSNKTITLKPGSYKWPEGLLQ